MASAPNLVFVFPDQFRIQSLGFWNEPGFEGLLRGGSDPVVTPNLDGFARDSLVLTRAASSAPVCSPFRGMLFSGCYPGKNGVPTNCANDRPDCGLRDDLTTFTDVLAAAGYDCGYIGKYHLDYPHPFDESRPDWYPGGWDVYTPPERQHGCTFWHSYGTFDVHKNPHYWDVNGNRTDPKRWSPLYEADVAADYIRGHAQCRPQRPRVAGAEDLPLQRGGPAGGDRPFALFVGMNPPHTPNSSLDDCEEDDFRHYADRDLRELLNRPNVKWNGNGNGTSAAPYYFAQVTGVDRAFGRVLKAIDDAGIRDNTIVVFTADHGELLCSHGRRGKNRAWSECFDIPFLLRYPGVLQAQTDDLLLTPVDIMPSLLSLMGISDSGSRFPEMDGTDYSGLWIGVGGDAPSDLVSLEQQISGSSGVNPLGARPARPSSVPYVRNRPGPRDESGMHRGYVPDARGVKTHHHTLVFEDLQDGNTTPVLYDDDADPYQVDPLPLDENGELVERLVSQLNEHCENMNDPWRPR
jgi:arylsulfatase A-like enzyme